MIGIPAGVKMHSAVFAFGPEAARETAAIALAQACGTRSAEIMDKRQRIFEVYRAELAALEEQGLVRLPVVPERCRHNGHMFYLLLPAESQRDALIERLAKA